MIALQVARSSLTSSLIGYQLMSLIQLKNQGTDEAAIKNAALNLLARRDHSRQELFVKLSKKFSNAQEIEHQLDALVEQNLLSEERFVESFIRAKKSQGKGPNYIKQQLRQRGISEYLVAAYVYERDEDWLHLANDVYVKKFGKTTVEDNKDRARRVRFMVSRGFSPETVFRLLDDGMA